MRNRQFCTPHLINLPSVKALERVVFDERSIRESWFQDLLFKNPSLIPIDDIEPLFGPMIPLVREMPTDVGPVDIAYINPQGFLTLVETKLFRNPQSRREVVAQILDYATAISKWSYQDLCDAIRTKRRLDIGTPTTLQAPIENDPDPIKPLVCDQPDYDEARFIDAVSQNLARGRFLLLIVGDGIQSGIEHLTDTLAATPHLGFSLALVELALFKTGESNSSYFVQPRILARTKEVVRAVIEIRPPLTPTDVVVSLPEVTSGGKGDRRRLTEEVMFETIAASLGKATTDQFRAFLSECEKLGIEPEARDTSISLFWYEPNTDRRFSFASIYADDGRVDVRFVLHNYRKSGLNQAIGTKYVNTLASLIPGAIVKENFKEGKAWTRIYVGPREITLADLLPKSPNWLNALQQVIQETEADGATKSNDEPA